MHLQNWTDEKLGPKKWSGKSYEFTLRLAFIYPIQPFRHLGDFRSRIQAFRSCCRKILPGGNAGRNWPFRIKSIFSINLVTSGWRQWAYLGAGAGLALALCRIRWRSLLCFRFRWRCRCRLRSLIAFAALSLRSLSCRFVAVAVAVVYLDYTMSRFGRKGMFYSLYVPCVVLSLLLIAAYSQSLKFQVFFTLIVFYVALPVINSVLDWCSLAITRGVLNNISEQKNSSFIAGKAGLDLFIALVFLAVLALSCTCVPADDELAVPVKWRRAIFRSGGLASPSARRPRRFGLVGLHHAFLNAYPDSRPFQYRRGQFHLLEPAGKLAAALAGRAQLRNA